MPADIFVYSIDYYFSELCGLEYLLKPTKLYLILWASWFIVYEIV